MSRSRSCDGPCLAKQPPKKADVRRLEIAFFNGCWRRQTQELPPLDGKAVMPYNSTCGSRRPPMTTLTITAKGQVTLKQELLKHLGVSPGEKIEADKLPDGRIVVKAAVPEARIADFIGCLSQKGGPKLTIDEMREIATRGWARSK